MPRREMLYCTMNVIFSIGRTQATKRSVIAKGPGRQPSLNRFFRGCQDEKMRRRHWFRSSDSAPRTGRLQPIARLKSCCSGPSRRQKDQTKASIRQKSQTNALMTKVIDNDYRNSRNGIVCKASSVHIDIREHTRCSHTPCLVSMHNAFI